MSRRDRLKKARQKLSEVLFYAGEEPVEFVIKDIGFEWSPFIEGSGDRIKAVKIDEIDISIFIYESTNKEIEFPPHFHKKNIEIVSVLAGVIEINTPNYTKIIKKGESIILKKGEHHSAKLSPFTSILLIYNPGFKNENWNANKSEEL